MSNQENISKETKKTRRKKSQRKSQQIKLAVIMIMVSVLVLSASTFAWYQMSKTANIQDMQFTADTLGNLLISRATEDGSDAKEYSNSLNLGFTDNNSAKLLPSTTADGETFYSPVYDENNPAIVSGVISVGPSAIFDGNKEIVENDGEEYYVYKKDFYIKTGDIEGETEYEIKLDPSGTSLYDKDAEEGEEKGTDSTYTSLRAVRVSFVANDVVTIYEPYSVSLVGDAINAQTKAGISGDVGSYGPSIYGDITITHQDATTFNENKVLCTIKEGVAQRITMYVWFEGNDDECANQIALDTIAGQIQFIAEEKTT